jgi:sortase (surface protein transpeptidase)
MSLGTGVRRALGLALSATSLVLAAGCAGPPPAGTAAPAAPAATAAVPPSDPSGAAGVTVLPASRPIRLTIPTIDVDTGVIDLGLKPDGTMEVPPDGATAGWYTESPTPGELGPAVLAAHVDWKGAKGVFYDLRRAQPGDEVSVDRADGQTATFTVRRVEQYPKDRFPTEEVYGDVDTAQLRLITCGGDFDGQARSYRDNIVVYAELLTSRS